MRIFSSVRSPDQESLLKQCDKLQKERSENDVIWDLARVLAAEEGGCCLCFGTVLVLIDMVTSVVCVRGLQGKAPIFRLPLAQAVPLSALSNKVI